MPDFSRLFLQGDFIKSIVRRIIDESGYVTYPFGYESFLSQIKGAIQEKHIDSRITRQIRSSPDLLVYKEKTDFLRLVEVKSVKWYPRYNEVPIRWDPDTYKEYWPQCVMTLVIPAKPMFYARQAKTLQTHRKGDQWNLDLTEFKRFETIFKSVEVSTLKKYRPIVLQVFEFFGEKST